MNLSEAEVGKECIISDIVTDDRGNEILFVLSRLL